MRSTTSPTDPIPQQDQALAKARRLAWMFFDVDGVLTDGGLLYDAHGEALKRFHVQDGHGLKELRQSGVRIGILSGRAHSAVAVRARELGFDVVIQGENNKVAAFDRLVKEHQLDPQSCGHMGDDTPDLELFERLGFAASVPNAVPAVIAAADWVSSRHGGMGAVRECCDFILKARA